MVSENIQNYIDVKDSFYCEMNDYGVDKKIQ